MNGNIEESIEGMKVIKVFNHEEQAIADFTETNENFRKAATNANFFSGIMGPCSTGINNASYATIALVGGILALSGNLDIGTFFTFLSYSKQFTQPINQIANQMNTVFSALAGAERVFEIMDMDPEVDEGTVTLEEKLENGERKLFWNNGGKISPVEGNVVFDDVDFSYVPEKPVLKNISLYAKHGQKIAFVGSTGAGKTTITNLINRFYDIQCGTITYDGIDIKRIKKTICAARFPSCFRIRICSPAPLWIISATAGLKPRTKNASRRPSLLRHIRLSGACPRDITPKSAATAIIFRRVNASFLQSQEPRLPSLLC